MADGGVRVRFAPSPTGFLHVGGARTAIFNWLFAEGAKGQFVIRIEDTDRERSTTESEQSLVDDLRWLGLRWAEGPDVGGAYAPYRQSERIDLYRQGVDTLLGANKAFPCFCTDEVLESKRQAALDAGKPPQYDGTCRGLTADQIAANRQEQIPEVIRFIVREGSVLFSDVIRGDIEMGTDMVGDFVLLRSSGLPTYNYAAVVDDGAMKISHVLRGEEHLPNTLRQILLYEALGIEIPQFGHLPLILAEDRSKLSKRHSASSVGELRKLGFLPEAVVNYLVLLGWSHPDGEEIIDVEDLKTLFSTDRVGKSAAVFDVQKLRWMNGQYIRKKTVEDIFDTADPFFPEFIHTQYSPEMRSRILGVLQDSVETLSDLREAAGIFASAPNFDDEAVALLQTAGASQVLAALEEILRGAPKEFTDAEFKTMIKEAGKVSGSKGKDLYFPIRAALTGSVHGPDLAEVASIKGTATVLELIARARGIGASN